MQNRNTDWTSDRALRKPNTLILEWGPDHLKLDFILSLNWDFYVEGFGIVQMFYSALAKSIQKVIYLTSNTHRHTPTPHFNNLSLMVST